MKKLKPILLAVATVIVVGVSIYLRYFGGTPRGAPGEPAPAETEVADDAARPRIREVPRIALRGFMGDLASVQQRVTSNGELVAARLKQGRQGRSFTDTGRSRAEATDGS